MVSNVDFLSDLKNICVEKIKTRSKAIENMWSLLRIKYFQLSQRSWSKLLREGNTNSGYFHAFVKSRGRHNDILPLKFKDGWIERVYKIRQEVVKHFYDIFRESNVHRPCLDDVVFRHISKDNNLVLTSPFSL